MSTAHANVIAIHEKVATPGIVGQIVYWDYTGCGDVNRAALATAWEARGGKDADLPSAVSPLVALRRSLMSVCEVSDPLIRPLRVGRGGQEGAKVEGWAVMRETHDANGRPVHTLRFTVEIQTVPLGGRKLHFDGDRAGYAHLMADIGARLKYEMAHLTSAEMGSWLVRRAAAEHAVSIRANGGVYFVPAPHEGGWAALKATVAEVRGARMHEIPAMDSAAAVASIMDALTAEVTTAADEMLEELQGLAENDPRKNQKVKNRAKVVGEIEAKVSGYETLLGTKMTALRERLDGLQAVLAMGNVVGGA